MGQTTLNWQFDGADPDEFRVYRADSPMDPEALPAALATVAGSLRQYVDTTVTAGDTYFYRVSAYSDPIEKVSDEIEHTAEVAYEAETLAWEASIVSRGGSITSGEKDLADGLVRALKELSCFGKIVYLLPFIGDTMVCHVTPLIDPLGKGPCTNSGFVDADAATATGLSNATEANKWLVSPFKPSQLGTSNNGGLFWWELAWGNGSNVEPMGAYGTNNSPDERFVLDLRSSLQWFRWGGVSNAAGPATTTSNGFYFGQRSSATLRRIYKDGASLGSDSTASAPATRASNEFMNVHGVRLSSSGGPYNAPWKGRGGLAGFGDGTFTDAEVLELYETVRDGFMTDSGRI